VVSSAGRPRAARHVLPADVSKIVDERSGGRCEVRYAGCSTWATQRHHRITQKSGGRHGAAKRRSDRSSNLLKVCSWCHGIVTDHPKLGYQNGWCLKEWQEPTAEPVLYRGDLVYLDDAGNKISQEKAGA
jgi:hypothetical protein